MTGLEGLLIQLAGSAASPLFNAAIEAVQTRLQKAADERPKDAAMAIAYLDTANTLMSALEAEADEILLTAMRLPSSPDPDTRAGLIARLDGLIHGEVMRPALEKVHGQLTVLGDVLKEAPGRFFGQARTGDKVNAILQQFTAMTGHIGMYLTWLQAPNSAYRGSAPFFDELLGLRQLLMDGADAAVIADRARNLIEHRYPLAVKRGREIGELTEGIRTQLR